MFRYPTFVFFFFFFFFHVVYFRFCKANRASAFLLDVACFLPPLRDTLFSVNLIDPQKLIIAHKRPSIRQRKLSLADRLPGITPGVCSDRDAKTHPKLADVFRGN